MNKLFVTLFCTLIFSSQAYSDTDYHQWYQNNPRTWECTVLCTNGNGTHTLWGLTYDDCLKEELKLCGGGGLVNIASGSQLLNSDEGLIEASSGNETSASDQSVEDLKVFTNVDRMSEITAGGSDQFKEDLLKAIEITLSCEGRGGQAIEQISVLNDIIEINSVLQGFERSAKCIGDATYRLNN